MDYRCKLNHAEQNFKAKLTYYNGEKLSQFSIEKDEPAQAAKQALLAAADGHLNVLKLEKKQRKRNPAAPFTTSTLQQEAARKLGFTTKRTMMVSQQLYEGIDIGGETSGLITYMRTDSVNLADEALENIRELIAENMAPKMYQSHRANLKPNQKMHKKRMKQCAQR